MRRFDPNYRMDMYESLRAQADKMTILDTHEHLPGRESQRDQKVDVISEFFSQYISADLVSAGLSYRVMQEDVRGMDLTTYTASDRPPLPLMEKWKLIEPYFDACRTTGYGRFVEIAARELYGIDEINRDTVETLNERFQKARSDGNRYEYVLKERCHIETSFIDEWPCDHTMDSRYIRLSGLLCPLIHWESAQDVRNAAKIVGEKHTTFRAYLDATERAIRDCLRYTHVFKCTLSYFRSLAFSNETDFKAAEAEFDRLINAAEAGKSVLSAPCFEDCIMHHVLRILGENRAVFQFHTGLLEPWPRPNVGDNDVRRSNPELLTNLILKYPKVRFDIFHIGYPYQDTLGAMAKGLPNVFIDMCWAHSISPATARRALNEYLDAVPSNKISGFGGDCRFVDGVYGHLTLAKDNICQVLAEKVCDGSFSEKTAFDRLDRLLYRTPRALLVD